MKTLFTYYNFPESWAELNPRFSGMDQDVNISLKLFTDLDAERAAVVDSDCLPQQVASFMVRVAVAMSYCSVVSARLGGHLNQAMERMDNLQAEKLSALFGNADPALRPKSEAAANRAITVDAQVIKLKWEIEDLKVAKEYSENVFRTLQKDAENWRARYYGAQSDKKMTPGINAPDDGERMSGYPPRIGR